MAERHSLRTKIETIETAVATRENDISTLRQNREDIATRKKRAVAEVARPFDEQLAQLDTEISRLESTRAAEQLTTGGFGEVVHAALALEAAKLYDNDPQAVKLLGNEYEMQLRGVRDIYKGTLAKAALQRVLDFESFNEALVQSNGGLPFVAAHLHWYDFDELVASHDGRKSRNFYRRIGTLFIGRARAYDVMPRYSSEGQPESIDLLLGSAKRVTANRGSWDEGYAETADVSRHEIITLFGRQSRNSFHQRHAKWDLSNTNEISAKQDTYTLSWGEEAKEMINLIKNDPHTLHHLSSELKEVTL